MLPLYSDAAVLGTSNRNGALRSVTVSNVTGTACLLIIPKAESPRPSFCSAGPQSRVTARKAGREGPEAFAVGIGLQVSFRAHAGLDRCERRPLEHDAKKSARVFW